MSGWLDSQCPCKKCTKRNETNRFCHDSCEEYLAWAAKKRECSQKAKEAWKLEKDIRSIRDRGVKNARSGASRLSTKKGDR